MRDLFSIVNNIINDKNINFITIETSSIYIIYMYLFLQRAIFFFYIQPHFSHKFTQRYMNVRKKNSQKSNQPCNTYNIVKQRHYHGITLYELPTNKVSIFFLQDCEHKIKNKRSVDFIYRSVRYIIRRKKIELKYFGLVSICSMSLHFININRIK